MVKSWKGEGGGVTVRTYLFPKVYPVFILKVSSNKKNGGIMFIGMSQNKSKFFMQHGCHYLGDMVVRMRKVLAIPRGWCVPHACFITL